MAAENLTGSRIRERRLIAGLRQADLARDISISASYLNLIEHNRRRIGGKLLNKIAFALDVEPAVLAEGAEATLISALREAEASLDSVAAELDRIEDFAERFPGWARLLSGLHRRIGQLEQTVESLNDRLNHDPQLAASVHDVLSTVASIRSTASILAETDQLEAEWLARFHANINEDSARLADSSRALADYLEGEQERTPSKAQVPLDEADAFLAAHNHNFPSLEQGRDGAIDLLLEGEDLSTFAKDIVRRVLTTYVADARWVSLADMRAAVAQLGPQPDPLHLSQRLNVPVATVLRRLAHLPELACGYVQVDRAGSLLWQRAVPGFTTPRGGAACPLWPIFAAFSQPGTAQRTDIAQMGRQQTRFTVFAITDVIQEPGYNAPPLLQAGMLIYPNAAHPAEGSEDIVVGSTCRVCAKPDCAGRRELSVLTTR